MTMERIKVGRRVVKFSRVSSVQFLAYYRSPVTREEYSAMVLEYSNYFEVVGINKHFKSLHECADAILSDPAF